MSHTDDIFYNFENPAEAARPFAENVGINSDFNPEFHKNITLPYLDQLADDQDMFGTYFVGTGKAISIPVSFEADEQVSVWDMDTLNFEGRFACHSLIQIGKINDARIRALCLSFSEALLLPYFEEIPEEHILHVPILAVNEISRTD